MKQITVLLAEDHVIVREGFRRMLELETDMEVVGEAKDGRQAVALVGKLHPDVVLMDIAMPLLNGLEAARQILKSVPGARILILSAHNDDAYVQNAIKSGAMGFLLKQTSSHEVCRAIREIHQGKTFFSPSISMRLNRLKPQLSGRTGRLNKKAVRLTSREMEVLQLIAEGEAKKKSPQNSASASRLLKNIASISCRSSKSMMPPGSPATPSARASSKAVSS
jgi:DNA-binding NarL/FixJ family response regulator